MRPRVSVVTAVYNGERYLRPAIKSILEQSFDCFEFIVIDDGSMDETGAIIAEFAGQDDRLIPVRNETNIGLTASLIKGVAISRGEYIARQDADDISLPERLAREVEFLDASPDVCLIGATTGLVDRDDTFLGNRTLFRPEADMNQALIGHNYLAHGSIMARKSIMAQVGGYRPIFRYAQDYDLWLRMSEQCGVALLDEVLYWRRVTPNSISANRFKQQAQFRALARKLAAERREHGRELTAIDVASAEVLNREPSDAEGKSLGYLGYARDLLSVGHVWRGIYYFLHSVIAQPWNPAPWQWLASAAGRRIKGRS